MAVLIRFPKVAPGVEQAMVGAWRKSTGDAVTEGEGLVEIVTDKATFDLECEASGVLLSILAPEKSTIPVNYVLAVVGDPGEQAPDVAQENLRIMEAHQQRPTSEAWPAPNSTAQAPVGNVRATPGARRVARQAGVAIQNVADFKGGGVVREADVQRYLSSQKQPE